MRTLVLAAFAPPAPAALPRLVATCLGALLAAAAVAAQAPPPTGAAGRPGAGTGTTATVIRGERPDDGEHGPVPAHGIEVAWPWKPNVTLRLDEPEILVKLINRDPVAYAVAIRVLEDAGTQQSRRLGPPLTATVPAGGSLSLPVRFDSEGPLAPLTHSGMVVVLLTACPLGGGPCLNGASEPLFFHRQGGARVVYGERVLCSRFRCGALLAKGKPEPGTWRVMGGGPLHALPLHEETGDEDERPIDGGVQ